MDPDGRVVCSDLDGHEHFCFDSGSRKPTVLRSDRGRVVVATSAGQIRTFDESGALLWERQLSSAVGCLAFTEDGNRLAVGGLDWVAVLRASDGEVVFLREHRERLVDVAFSHDGQRLFIQPMTTNAQVLLSSSGRTLLELDREGTVAIQTALAVLPGDRVVTADNEGRVTVWSP